MKEKNLFKKTLLCMLAAVMLLYFGLWPGIAPQIRAYAEEDAGTDTHTEADNPRYTLTATNGEHVVTTANPDETTVLIFGHVNCSKTRSTLTSVASSNWVKRSDIRVIYADAEGNSQESVMEQEEGYQCPGITFCYDTTDGGMLMKAIMTEYNNRLGKTTTSYPFIVLIDKNNKLQNILTGTKTADEILNEIKKFEDIDEAGTGTDTPDSGTGVENYIYGLKSIDGTTVSTKANPNETTVLIFGYTTCGNTKATLQSIDQSDWISRSDIRVVYADDITMPDTVSGSALSMVQEYAENYTSGKINFCYDHSERNHNIAFKYLSLYDLTGGAYPFIVLIDQNNKVQNITLGRKTADEILAEIEKFTKSDETTGGDEENPSDPTTPDTPSQDPGTTTPDTPSQDPGTTTPDTPSQNPGTTTPDTPSQNPINPGPSISGPTIPGSSSSGSTVTGPTTPGTSTPDTTEPGTDGEPSVDPPTDTVPSEPQESVYEKVTLEDGSLQLKDSNGTIIKDQLVTASDGNRYYADENGVVAVRKIVSCDQVKYFAKEDGAIAQNEFCKTEKGSTVYAQADGSLATNQVVNVGGKKYYAKSNCALAANGFFTTAKGSKIYAKASGELVVSQTFQVDGKRYYAKASGALVRSAFYTTAKGSKIYAQASGALVTNKVFQVDGKRYCAKASGALVKNAFYTLPSGEKVYAKASGLVAENQIFRVRGKKFYADQNGNIAANKWVTVGDKKYYCSASYKITKVSKISK